jgi:hypothetical protein
VCKESIFGGDVIESYTLTHNYLVKRGGETVVAAPGTGADITLCSARCLVHYVNAKIAPDSLGE